MNTRNSFHFQYLIHKTQNRDSIIKDCRDAGTDEVTDLICTVFLKGCLVFKVIYICSVQFVII